MNVELLGPDAGPFDLLVAGDVYLRGEPAGRLAPPLAALLKGATTIVNLEAPLVARPAPAAKAGPHLAIAPEAAAQLRSLSVDVVGLANNHMGDHGPEGVIETIAACRDAGLVSAGAGGGSDQAMAPATVEVAGARVAVMAGAEHEFGVAEEGRAGVAPISAPAFAAAVRRARSEHDVVVVLAHGGVEELPVSPPQRARQLRDLLDAGADLVVGSHPHVVQGWEVRGDGVAFHSVGDFVFDRDAHGARPPGAMVGVKIEGGRLAGVGLLAVEEREGVIALASAAPFAALAEAVGDEGVWQELAWRAFVDRYLPLFARVGAPEAPAPSGPPGVRTARDALARLRPGTASPREPEGWEALHLLNQLRCESQRWTIETALALVGGLVEDRRNADTAARAEALHRAAGQGSGE